MGNVCCDEDTPMNKGNGRTSHKVARLQQKNRQQNNRNSNERPVQVAEIKTIPNLVKKGVENYQSIKYLGRGTFGDVVLAEDKETNEKYAMKIIDKRKIKQFNVLQCQLIRNVSDNELFVKIRETFQNQSKIYIVMEYFPRGDIYFYLKKKEFVFTENIIKMLVAEVIVGIQILHKQNIIYRELKPENILVTNEGHIKLTDYGLSRMIVQEKNQIFTFVGTLEYTAPEVLEGHYGKKVDLWAIGIFMFELRFERNPFESTPTETSDLIQINIEKINIEDVLNQIVGLISHQFRDVLIKLLQKDPEKRLSLDELKQHSFFGGVNWEEIPLRKNTPPLKQFLENDHFKFRDPNNEMQLAHRNIMINKSADFKTNLYEFRSSK